MRLPIEDLCATIQMTSEDRIDVKKRLRPKFKTIEQELTTGIAFDLAKVFYNVSAGHFAILDQARVPFFEIFLRTFHAIDPNFDYVARPTRISHGTSVLSEEQLRAIEQHKMLLVEHEGCPAETFDLEENGVLFIWYNKEFIKKREESSGLCRIVSQLADLKDFVDFVNYSPILQPRTACIQATDQLIGTFLDYPPCCIWLYKGADKLNAFLDEEHQKYIDFVPCKPDCEYAIPIAGAYKRIFDTLGLDVNFLNKKAEIGFQGVLSFDMTGSLPEAIEKLLSKKNAYRLLGQENGRYIITCNTRLLLSAFYHALTSIPGVSNVVTNTIVR